MARYDWGRGYGRENGYDRMGGSEYSTWGDARSKRLARGLWGGDPGMNRFWGIDAEPRGESGYDRGFGRGYDRGLYGESYPSYGGYPGGPQRGMYYGGRGYDAGMQRWRAGGYDRAGGYGFLMGSRGGYELDTRGYGTGPGGGYGTGYGSGGYDAGYARMPFVPEEAYQRHPELNRPHGGPRSGGMREGFEYGELLDDDEIRQAVRQSLHQDSWIQPDRVQVEVNGGVVTLTGEVDDYMQARYAWDDAWETDGVRGVINNLTVRTDQPHEAHGDVVPQSSGGKRKK